uniref:Interferon regulatory factor 3 n=1 Tax=Hippocampus comes TaxID=109280 RepID=A0A3Q2Z879_HIPCM
MAHSKPLFIQWLRAQIDSGAYPGVQWTNQEQTEFCIPWKHALRQDSSDSDILIFKCHASGLFFSRWNCLIVSGNGRIQGEASVWKRNFRCALRAKKFQMIADNKNDTANPHKVYRWPDESTAGANMSRIATKALPYKKYVPVSCARMCVCLLDRRIQISRHLCTVDFFNPCQLFPSAEEAAAFEFPPEQQERRHPIVIGGHMLPWQQPHPVAAEDEVGGAGSPGQPAHPMEGAVGEACGGQLAKQFLDNIHKTKDGNHFKTEFRIIVHYRGQKVSEQLVANEAGFRLIYRPEQAEPALDQESGLSLVSLPSPVTIKDQKQAKLTQCILDKLGEGLDVGVSGDVVYGQRRGEIKAFWSFSKFDHSGRPQEISKQQPQPLYPFRDFIHGILDFITLESKECGPCSLFLCLGEKWPDPQNWPWTKKLIIVEVVLTSLELLKNMAMEGGASSLKSVDLQVSLEEMVIG